MEYSFYLFDIDGVLIQPGGYRAAVKATVSYFLNRCGITDFELDEKTIALFEAIGITSEWDIVPISLALILNQLARSIHLEVKWKSLEQAENDLRARSVLAKDESIYPVIRNLEEFLHSSGAPVDVLASHIRNGKFIPLFSNLDADLLLDLWGHTRNIRQSATTKVFQNFILGNELFEKTYGFPSLFSSRPFLQEYDRVLISPTLVEDLTRLIQDRKLYAAAMTARPSLPPVKTNLQNGYSPEAEMALQISGFQNLPFIGYGGIQYLAEMNGVSPEIYLKPSPVQALAAILVSLGAESWSALQAAARIDKHRKNSESNRLPIDSIRNLKDSKMKIHIFEDSPIGIRAAQQAADQLRDYGIQTTVNSWGITQNADKKAALESLGAVVTDDVNRALQAALLG